MAPYKYTDVATLMEEESEDVNSVLLKQRAESRSMKFPRGASEDEKMDQPLEDDKVEHILLSFSNEKPPTFPIAPPMASETFEATGPNSPLLREAKAIPYAGSSDVLTVRKKANEEVSASLSQPPKDGMHSHRLSFQAVQQSPHSDHPSLVEVASSNSKTMSRASNFGLLGQALVWKLSSFHEAAP